jgi:2-polyprenyl-3-methyl-5-hydroxy-6-metoxy-1,4-benzoquinol methylase
MPDQVSWFRPHLETSLALIESAAPGRDAAIIDVGGGTSTLVDDLLSRGYTNATVLDISRSALDVAKKRLAGAWKSVQWLCADVTRAELPAHAYDLWHDRAVFHFLTQPDQRRNYVSKVISSLKPGGHIIVSTFGPEGPTRCSGLDVVRYDAHSLKAEFGSRFRVVDSSTELHRTPFETDQQFFYCHFVLES